MRFSLSHEKVEKVNNTISKILTIPGIICLVLLASLIYLLWPILTNQVLIGCDLSAQYYLCEKMLEYLQQFRISGYDYNWFNGYPAFTFYNPLPYVSVCLVHLLSFKLLPLNFCLNLVLFLLPFLFLFSIFYTSNTFFRSKKTSFFAFILGYAALLTVNGYGIGLGALLPVGNFANSFAWPIFVFLIGTIENLKQTNKNKYLIISALLFACLILSHIFTAIFAVFLFGMYFIFNYKTLWKKLLIVFFSGILLTSFWWIPFLFNLTYTSSADFNGEGESPLIGIYGQFILGIIILVFAFIGIIKLFKEKNYFLPTVFLISLVFLVREIMPTYFSPLIHFYRFTADVIVLNIFISAYGFSHAFNYISKNNRIILFCIIAIGIATNLAAMKYMLNYVQPSKNEYHEETKQVVSYFAGTKERVLIDDDQIFYLIGSRHYFAGVLASNNIPTVNGLLIQSALSDNFSYSKKKIFDYNFLINKYVNDGKPMNIKEANYITKLEEGINAEIKKDIENLSLLGVKYILTGKSYKTPIIDYINSPENDILDIKETIGPYVIIEIKDPQPIFVETKYKPFLFINQKGIFSGLEFKNFSKEWFFQGYAIDHPIIYTAKNIQDIPSNEMNKIGGIILNTESCPNEIASYLLTKNKPIIITGMAENCSIKNENVVIVNKKRTSIKGSLTKNKNEANLELEYIDNYYKNIYEELIKFNPKKITYEKIEGNTGNENLKFYSNFGVIINYSYFPKWVSKNKNQTVFWTTPSSMFIFGEGDNEVIYK
ncbi:MAG: hypothetical protein WCX74_00960 [Candidatus Paceibacterota bacterium]